MCGIAGVVMRDGSTPDPQLLDRMSTALAHRGPDGMGRMVRGGTALLHLRLSIVDLSTGNQPLGTPGGVELVANGEIYNNPELRLRLAGRPFRTQSDCEPPVFLYGELGCDYSSALRGMYAIAVHDPVADRLVLSRDPFGIKPLYYVETEAAFAFASQPSALLATGLVPCVIDPVRRAELLQLKFTTGAETIFRGIGRVLPGETLVIERGMIVARSRQAAVPAPGVAPIPAREASRRLDAVLMDSVRAHLQSDVPYGLFLSGGIDSAALLALMHRATGSAVETITVGWEGGGELDESREAQRLAGLMGARCHVIEMNEGHFWNLAPRICAAVDDPTADAAILPTFMLGQAAAEAGLKVALSGEGADELFGGYSRYRKQLAPWRWFASPPRSRGLFRASDAWEGWRDGIHAAELAASAGRGRMEGVQATDIAEWLPNDLLIKLDRCLMIHGVEGRTPFLDPVVADFAFRLGDAQKASLRFGKVLLREWLAGAFPQAAAYARKKGFKPPIGRWIQSRAEQLEVLVADHPAIAPLFPMEAVSAILAQAQDQPQRAWSLLFYALWYSRHCLGVDPSGDIGEVLAAARHA